MKKKSDRKGMEGKERGRRREGKSLREEEEKKEEKERGI